jgi:hypothetical protein
MNKVVPFQVDATALLLRPEVNANFSAFIEQHRRIAEEAGFRWDMQLNSNGETIKGDEWDLRRMAHDGRPKTQVLRTFIKCLDAHDTLKRRGLASGDMSAVSIAWQDLIKAYAIEHVLVRRKGVAYIGAAANALRFVATVSQKEPWETTRLRDFGRASALRWPHSRHSWIHFQCCGPAASI